MCHSNRGVARVSVWGTGRAPKAPESRRQKCRGCGERVFSLRYGGGVPSPEFFLNFYIKMVSIRAFWVAIYYRLAACFTRIGNTRGIEIYCRSFQHFGNYNIILHPENCAEKNDKKRQKLLKIARKLRCFCTFSVIFLKFLRVVD